MKLFHLTPKNLGQSVYLKPFESENSGESEIGDARVCASPSIEQCIYGLHTIEWFKSAKADCVLCLFVYEIEDISSFVAYTEVYDYAHTEEHISFKQVPAKLVGIIHVPRMNNAKYLQEAVPVPGTGCVYERITTGVYSEYYAH